MNEQNPYAQPAAEVSAAAGALQAGSAALASERPQLARRLNMAASGVVSVSAGIAILNSTTPVLSAFGPAGIVLGIGAVGMSLFGRDDTSGHELSAYLQTRFDQIIGELVEIKQGIIEIDHRAAVRHEELCKRINHFQELVIQLHQRTIDCFSTLEYQLRTMSAEQQRQFNALTNQHAIQDVGRFFEKLEGKLRELDIQESHFNSYLREDGAMTDTLHEKFLAIYEMVGPAVRNEVPDYQNLATILHTAAHRLYYLKEHSDEVDLPWLCEQINTRLRQLIINISAPAPSIELSSKTDTWMHRPLLLKRLGLLCHSLEKRYDHSGHRELPKAAFELASKLQGSFVIPHIELLKQLLEKNILQSLGVFYLNQVTSEIVHTIEAERLAFERTQTTLARRAWDEKMRKVEGENALLCQRLAQGEFASRQVLSANEFIQRITNQGHIEPQCSPNPAVFIMGKNNSLELMSMLSELHAEQLKTILNIELEAMKATRDVIEVTLFSTDRVFQASSVVNMMYPDQATLDQGFNFPFVVPVSVINSLPHVAIQSICRNLAEVLWVYTIDQQHPDCMTITATLKLSDHSQIKILQAELQNPLIQYHRKHPLSYDARARFRSRVIHEVHYSMMELWFLFLNGGHYARERADLTFSCNIYGITFSGRSRDVWGRIGGVAVPVTIPVFPSVPYPGFIQSPDGTFFLDNIQYRLQPPWVLASKDEEAIIRELENNVEERLHEQFRQKLRQSFSEGGLHEGVLKIIDETFYVLVALIEFIQPNDCSAIISRLKHHHEIILKSVEHGLAGLEEAQRAFTAILEIFDGENFTPSDIHPLLKAMQQLEMFFSSHTPRELLRVEDKPAGATLSSEAKKQIEEAAEIWMKGHLKQLLLSGDFQKAADLIEGDPIDYAITPENSSEEAYTRLLFGLQTGLSFVRRRLFDFQEIVALRVVIDPVEGQIQEDIRNRRCAERGLPAGPSNFSSPVVAEATTQSDTSSQTSTARMSTVWSEILHQERSTKLSDAPFLAKPMRQDSDIVSSSLSGNISGSGLSQKERDQIASRSGNSGMFGGNSAQWHQVLEREKLKDEARLKGLMPEGYELGSAQSRGDCFFDAVAQALMKNTSDTYDVKSLRLLCRDYSQDPSKIWVKGLININRQKGGDYNYEEWLARIAFTAEEMNQERQAGLVGGAVWGNPHIEGRMICERLNIRIHLTEILDERDMGAASLEHPVMEQLITSEGSRSIQDSSELGDMDAADLVHLVCYQNHFVPLCKMVPIDIAAVRL